jgi:cysteine desulfurase
MNMSSRFIYLDHAAATPLDSSVLKAMLPYLKDKFYNPSASYGPAREINSALGVARSQIAHWLGARSNEIIFTAGGTEANNLAVRGIMQKYPDANVLVGGIEHESVLAPAEVYKCNQVAVHADGRIDLEDLRSKINNKTVLVSIGYANNEIGTVQSLRQVAKIVSEKRTERTDMPLYLHTDACQAANYLDLHVARIGVDMMTLNGGKIYGPKQAGVLYVKAGLRLDPIILGGGQERNLRSGTENVAGAVGLAIALDQSQKMRSKETVRLAQLQKQFIAGISKALPETSVNGTQKYRLPNNVHITFPETDNERLLIQLEEAGILAAAGSACSAGNEEPSHVLKAIGLSNAEARASIRFTLGRATTASMIEDAVNALAKLV